MTDRRLLFVHAHPDDEASKGAATAARYVDEGAEVVLVTCTGGEAGEILNEALLGTIDEADLPRIRAGELAAAVEAIGFTRTHLLGEIDSGWHEVLDDVPDADCFWHAPLDRPAGRLAAILREERSQVVITYPPDGGYPHPDHIRTHRVTMRAIELAADPAADVAGEPWQVARVLGCTVFTRPRLLALHGAMLDAGLESPYEEWLAPPEDGEERPVRDADLLPVAAQLDVAAWFPRRDTALLAHTTQVDPEGGWFRMPREIEVTAWPYEVYVAMDGEAPEGAPLDDVFAGLDLG